MESSPCKFPVMWHMNPSLKQRFGDIAKDQVATFTPALHQGSSCWRGKLIKSGRVIFSHESWVMSHTYSTKKCLNLFKPRCEFSGVQGPIYKNKNMLHCPALIHPHQASLLMQPTFHFGISIPLLTAIAPQPIPLSFAPGISKQNELNLTSIVHFLLTSRLADNPKLGARKKATSIIWYHLCQIIDKKTKSYKIPWPRHKLLGWNNNVLCEARSWVLPLHLLQCLERCNKRYLSCQNVRPGFRRESQLRVHQNFSKSTLVKCYRSIQPNYWPRKKGDLVVQLDFSHHCVRRW